MEYSRLSMLSLMIVLLQLELITVLVIGMQVRMDEELEHQEEVDFVIEMTDVHITMIGKVNILLEEVHDVTRTLV